MNVRARATHPARVIASSILLIALTASAALLLHALPAQESARTVLYMHGRIYTNDPQHP